MEDRLEIKALFPIYRILPLIILIEGFVSIATEILTIRQLLPFAGNSVVVTSLIIGIFLLFLALGYRNGGRITEDLLNKLRMNFFIAAVWLGIGLSYFFVLFFFTASQTIFSHKIIYPLIAYLLFVIAPLIYILGQTLPITMNMAKYNKSIGNIGGDTLGLSTLGSFLGATVTALVFMNYLGVAWTVFINVILLITLTLLLTKNRRSLILQLFLASFAIWVIYNLNIYFEKKIFKLTNHYANYQIINGGDMGLKPDNKILSINQSHSSLITSENKSFPYIERIKKILFQDLKLQKAKILVLGAGGFTLSAENGYGNQFTYVDIDREIKRAVVPDFITKIEGHLIVDDARHYIRSTAIQYDAIIMDAYSNTQAIPSHLLTQEYIHELKEKLTRNGVIIFNIIARPSLSDPYSKRIDNTIRYSFNNCMVDPSTYGNETANILYTCFNTANQKDSKIYTDNLNTSTTDSFEW